MKIVVIGAGPAGVTAVETLRDYDQRAEVVMFTSEDHPPYSPPAMVDHFISGTGAHLWRGEDWPERLGVDYRSGVQVTRVDPESHRIHTSGGGELSYDRLVIATGARLHAPLPGADLPGVYNLKSLTAAQSLVQRVEHREASTAVIVGAGFIGMEIALLLRVLGVAVTQVEMLDQVMAGMLDAETAGIALDMLRARGVFLQLDTKAAAFVGERAASGVQLESGEILHADILIAATGVKPNVDCLDGSGIAHGWGIQVDDHLRTSAADIYAAGDAVEAPDRLTGETYVHAIFPNAVEQGRVVGLNLAGYDTPYEGAERMNSLKHLGIPIMAAGLKDGDEVLRLRQNRTLRRVYIQDNRVVGFQIVGDIRAAGVLRALMLSRKDIRPYKDRLLDPGFGQGTIAWTSLAAYT